MATPQMQDYRFAGRLVTPIKNGPFPIKSQFEDIDVNVILSVLRRNKVPIISLDGDLWEQFPEFFNTPEFSNEYEKEYYLFENFRNEWVKVREKFLKSGIESMLIKSTGSFPYKSSNLDVLIKQSKRDRAGAILRELGYIQLHNVEEPYKTLFRTFSQGKSTLVVHLHNKVAWMNSFHDEELLWARYCHSAEDHIVDTPSREDSILILTAHWFYEDKEIKLSDIINISTCLMKGELDWAYMIAVAGKRGWLEGFYFGLLIQSFVEKNLYGKSLIESYRLEKMKSALPRWIRTYLNKKVYSQRIALPFKLPKILGKSLHFVKTLKDKTTTPAKKIYEMIVIAHGSLFVVLFGKLKVNIRYQPAMLIAISGVDGSGKTTYAAILSEILDLCELRKRIVWSRVGSSNFLKPFSKMAQIFYNLKTGKGLKKNSDNLEESEARRKDLFGKSSVTKLLGVHLLLLEMLWQYSFKVALPLLQKKVVICDRYIYDTLVDITTRYGINPNDFEGKLFRKILTALAPKPDIAYVLFIPHREAIRREKADLRISQLVKHQISTYREIAGGFNLIQINTSGKKGPTDIANEMIYEILTKYYEKWPNKNSYVKDKFRI